MKVQLTDRIDHFLIARTQARINGANAHHVHALLGNYLGLCALREPEAAPRLAAIEHRLRVFCQTGRLHLDHAPRPTGSFVRSAPAEAASSSS